MTSMNIYRCLGGIDPELIARAAPAEIPRKKKKKDWIKWVSLAAACLALVICIVPVWDALFDGTHGDAPVSNSFDSLEDVHKVLGYDTLYAGLDLDQTSKCSIAVSFASYDAPDGSQADLENPLQLLIRTAYPNGDTTDTVHYYVIFNKGSVEDSHIGGYEEQGLTKEFGGVTVHYSMIQDGATHGQAKFLYGGDLYVIDVVSGGDDHTLDTYIGLVLDGLGE